MISVISLLQNAQPMIWWWLRSLKTRDRFRFMKAADELAAAREPRAVPQLIEALAESDDWIRETAAHALGEIGDHRAIEPLSHLVEDDIDVVRQAAIEALTRIDPHRFRRGSRTQETPGAKSHTPAAPTSAARDAPRSGVQPKSSTVPAAAAADKAKASALPARTFDWTPS